RRAVGASRVTIVPMAGSGSASAGVHAGNMTRSSQSSAAPGAPRRPGRGGPAAVFILLADLVMDGRARRSRRSAEAPPAARCSAAVVLAGASAQASAEVAHQLDEPVHRGFVHLPHG